MAVEEKIRQLTLRMAQRLERRARLLREMAARLERRAQDKEERSA